MKIITALGNEIIAKKIKENISLDIIGTDIQYKEAVIDILENNKNIDLLILSSILPGELDTYELINIIKYKNPKINIIIILEKDDINLKEFLISKGINNIYYNNKITFNEIIKKINEIKNINNNEKNNFEEKIIQINNFNIFLKIKNKIKYQKNKIINNIKKYKKINNKKIITIIGAPKVGKTIFSLILSSQIKNKKILIIDINPEKNDTKIIIGKKSKNIENNIIKWKKLVDIFIVSKEYYYKNFFENVKQVQKNLDNFIKQYDYIIIDIGDIKNNKYIIEKSDICIMLIEANLLGIKESKEILDVVINKYKIQKDNIKIIFNKQCITSIKIQILKIMFSDFKILGTIQYDKYYNFFVNSNLKYIIKKIKKNYLKIIKKIEANNFKNII